MVLRGRPPLPPPPSPCGWPRQDRPRKPSAALNAACLLPTPGHTEKIYSIKFHPLASDVLASSSYDKSVRIWDVRTGRQELGLHGHTDQVGSTTASPSSSLRTEVSCRIASNEANLAALAPARYSIRDDDGACGPS